MKGIVSVDGNIHKRRVDGCLLFDLSPGLFGLYLVNPLNDLIHLVDLALEVK